MAASPERADSANLAIKGLITYFILTEVIFSAKFFAPCHMSH